MENGQNPLDSERVLLYDIKAREWRLQRNHACQMR